MSLMHTNNSAQTALCVHLLVSLLRFIDVTYFTNDAKLGASLHDLCKDQYVLHYLPLPRLSNVSDPCLAFIAYDWLITLRREIDVFWTEVKLTSVSVLYISIRLLIVTGIIIPFLWTPHTDTVSTTPDTFYPCRSWLTSCVNWYHRG